MLQFITGLFCDFMFLLLSQIERDAIMEGNILMFVVDSISYVACTLIKCYETFVVPLTFTQVISYISWQLSYHDKFGVQ